MDRRLALVTGASAGIGASFARILGSHGYDLALTARRADRLEKLAEEISLRYGVEALTVTADLAEPEAPGQILDFLTAHGRTVDALINNAGYGCFAEFTATEFAVWAEQLQVMLVNTARLSHAALGGMLARDRGALVNISSLAAEFPLPFQAAYNIAKSGLTALNESLMMEVSGTGVVILDVRPGDYRTDFEGSVLRPQAALGPRPARAWAAFVAMMESGPPPAHAAAALRRALLRHRSGTVRTGRFFQAVVAPFISRFGSLPLKRRIQASYFNVS
jgi:short-subunit dehydrogenase